MKTILLNLKGVAGNALFCRRRERMRVQQHHFVVETKRRPGRGRNPVESTTHRFPPALPLDTNDTPG